MKSHKGCGGTVLVGDMGGEAHRYCDVCHAFAPVAEQLPDGIDLEANKAAWDAGELRSPGVQTVEVAR